MGATLMPQAGKQIPWILPLCTQGTAEACGTAHSGLQSLYPHILQSSAEKDGQYCRKGQILQALFLVEITNRQVMFFILGINAVPV